MAVVTAARPRRTQEERRTETRRGLMDVAIECLGDPGHARASAPRVARRLGVSRGEWHRRPTRLDLFASPIERLVGKQLEEKTRALSRLRPKVPMGTILDMAWSGFSALLFVAPCENWVAADPLVQPALPWTNASSATSSGRV